MGILGIDESTGKANVKTLNHLSQKNVFTKIKSCEVTVVRKHPGSKQDFTTSISIILPEVPNSHVDLLKHTSRINLTPVPVSLVILLQLNRAVNNINAAFLRVSD